MCIYTHIFYFHSPSVRCMTFMHCSIKGFYAFVFNVKLKNGSAVVTKYPFRILMTLSTIFINIIIIIIVAFYLRHSPGYGMNAVVIKHPTKANNNKTLKCAIIKKGSNYYWPFVPWPKCTPLDPWIHVSIANCQSELHFWRDCF